ncbi:hypothetical protein [Capnocytophaga canimorsus]|nr:hypothetical protein [Capnocytophaga canimorsus]
MPVILLSFAILTSFSIIVKVRKNLPVLLMFVFFMTYVINLIPFFIYDYYIFAYPPTEGFYTTLRVHTLFLFSIDIFLKSYQNRFYINTKIPQDKSQKMFIFLVILFLFFLLFSVRGDTILDTGGYGQEGNTSGLGGFGEYFIILIPLLYIFGGDSYTNRKIIFILLLSMGLKLLLYGGRIGVLMMALAVFILYFDTEKRNISPIKLLLFSLPVLYTFVLLGSIRANILFLLNSSWYEIFLIPFREDFMKTQLEFFGNQNDIFYSSAILNKTVDLGIIDVSSRLEMFMYNVFSLVVPYSFLPSEASVIPHIQATVAKTGGGALISSYFYFFLSYPGVIFIGWFIAKMINMLQRSTNILFILYMFVVLCTYPRWFGYNMISLFKISFYIIPVYLGIKFLLKNKKYD